MSAEDESEGATDPRSIFKNKLADVKAVLPDVIDSLKKATEVQVVDGAISMESPQAIDELADYLKALKNSLHSLKTVLSRSDVPGANIWAHVDSRKGGAQRATFTRKGKDSPAESAIKTAIEALDNYDLELAIDNVALRDRLSAFRRLLDELLLARSELVADAVNHTQRSKLRMVGLTQENVEPTAQDRAARPVRNEKLHKHIDVREMLESLSRRQDIPPLEMPSSRRPIPRPSEDGPDDGPKGPDVIPFKR